MKKTASAQRSAGFTLLEVLIALVIFSIGILGVASMQTSAISGNFQANRLSQAASWASDRIEILMARDYDDPLLNATVPAGTEAAAVPAALDNLGTARAPATSPDGFEVYWNVAENYPIENCKTIRVLVRRSDKGIMKTVAQNFVKMRMN